MPAQPLPVGCSVMPEPWVGPQFWSVNPGIHWGVVYVQLYLAVITTLLLKDHSSSNGEERQSRVGHDSVSYLGGKKATLALLTCAVHSTFQRSGKLCPFSFAADASAFMLPLSWCGYLRFPTWSLKSGIQFFTPETTGGLPSWDFGEQLSLRTHCGLTMAFTL